MSKIFKIKRYSDGGPNDRGCFAGFLRGESEKQIRDEINDHTGFIEFKEVSLEDYTTEKEIAFSQLNELYKY